MTDQLKPCPFCGSEATKWITESYSCDSADRALGCEKCNIYLPYATVFEDEAPAQTDIDTWNTRPSASREIAVKPLEFETTWSHVWRCDQHGMMLVDESKDQTGDKFCVYFCSKPLRDNDGKAIFHGSYSDAVYAAQEFHERRILSAIDNLGNTDPIAKDDELRKVQGGWRDGFETGICRFTVRHRVTTYTSGNELRGPAVHFGDYISDRDARQALADCGFTNGEFGWRRGYTDATISRVVEYGDPLPTEQPSVRDAARVLLDTAFTDKNSSRISTAMSLELRAELDPSAWNTDCEMLDAFAAALRSLAQGKMK